MSGGDGCGHSTGAYGISGNINDGPTGLGVGSGASDGSGWSSENNPQGGGSSSDIRWGGGSGHGNGGGDGNSDGGSRISDNLSTVATPVAFGFPALSIPGAGGLAVSISAGALSAATTDIMAALRGPFKFDFWGVALYGILPSQTAKDDSSMMSEIVTSLPTDDITELPVSSLPLDKATVNVNAHVVDDVKDERQNISVISGVPVNALAVGVRPTERPDVFTASTPGAPVLNISVNNNTPAVQTLNPGVTNNTDKNVRLAGFTQGGNTKDAVIRLPKDSGYNAIYVSVSDVLSPDQVKQRQDEENRRQQEQDATHPIKTAERNYERARAELNQTNGDVTGNQERQAKTAQVYNPRKSELDAANKALADAIAKIKQFDRFACGPTAGGHRMWQMAGFRAQRAQTDANNEQAAFDAVAKEKSDADTALSAAQKCRKRKENKEKDAEDKLDKEGKQNKLGKATGKSKPVGDKWLDDAGKDSGVPIPDRIADKLRDKEFKSFGDFRKKLWGEVSKGPDLNKQFKDSNKTNIQKGKASLARRKDQVGGREHSELHHDKPISQDGDVYDMNNIRVTAPRRHVDIHRGK